MARLGIYKGQVYLMIPMICYTGLKNIYAQVLRSDISLHFCMMLLYFYMQQSFGCLGLCKALIYDMFRSGSYVVSLLFISLAKPKLRELLSFKGTEKTFNLAIEVAAGYSNLGVFLLNDETGAIVQALENEHNKNAEKINMAIFSQWLQGKGTQPVSWSTLIDVLRKIGLGTLAGDNEGGMM